MHLLFGAEQRVPSPPPLFFLCLQSLNLGRAKREGVGLDCVQHIYLPRALPMGGDLPIRLEAAQAPGQMLLKTTFTKAKPAE